MYLLAAVEAIRMLHFNGKLRHVILTSLHVHLSFHTTSCDKGSVLL